MRRTAVGLSRRLFGTSAMEASPTTPVATLSDLLNKSKPVVSLAGNSTLLDVAKKMTQESASTLFVEDHGYIIGVVKEKNVIQRVDELLQKDQTFESVGVQDVMETDVQYGTMSSTVRESLELLNKSKQDHLPILSSASSSSPGRVEDARVLDVNSIISAKHIIGQFYCDTIGTDPENLSTVEREKLETEAQKTLKLPTVKNLMKIKQQRAEEKGELGMMVLNTLYHDKISVAETIRQMTKYEKGSVAIMDICRDTPMLRGIVTEQDIIRRALTPQLNLEQVPVVDIMTCSNLTTVSSKDTLLACAFKMLDSNVRHLPVVSPKGSHILGMISSKDVVAYFCELWEH